MRIRYWIGDWYKKGEDIWGAGKLFAIIGKLWYFYRGRDFATLARILFVLCNFVTSFEKWTNSKVLNFIANKTRLFPPH